MRAHCNTRRGEGEEAVARTPDVVTRACIATEKLQKHIGAFHVANKTFGGRCSETPKSLCETDDTYILMALRRKRKETG